MPKERWKPILDGRYEISSRGRCRSWITGLGRRKVPRLLGTDSRRSGYIQFSVTEQSSRQVKISAHRAVLLAFVGPCPPGKQAAHNNGIRTDNRLANLRWATRAENQEDSRRHGTLSIGTHRPLAKLNDTKVRKARSMYLSGRSQGSIARKFGVTSQTVCKAINRVTWKHVV